LYILLPSGVFNKCRLLESVSQITVVKPEWGG